MCPPKLEKIWFFGVKSWFFTRNTPKIFVPPSALHIFFKCVPPPTWNPGSAPAYHDQHLIFLCNHQQIARKMSENYIFLFLLLFYPKNKQSSFFYKKQKTKEFRLNKFSRHSHFKSITEVIIYLNTSYSFTTQKNQGWIENIMPRWRNNTIL